MGVRNTTISNNNQQQNSKKSILSFRKRSQTGSVNRDDSYQKQTKAERDKPDHTAKEPKKKIGSRSESVSH